MKKLLLTAALAWLLGCAAQKPVSNLTVIITPSLDNPFFSNGAEAATRKAVELGYQTPVQTHDDDAHKQDQVIDTAMAKGAAA